MNCTQCPYSGTGDPEDIFRHMIQVHGMTRQNTPYPLRQFWDNHSQSGYYEAPHPISGLAPHHQQTALANQTIRMFNPNPNHRITISPTIVPEPWVKKEENFYTVEVPIEDQALKSVIIKGSLTPGHGKVTITKKEEHENTGLINKIFGGSPTSTLIDGQIISEEFRTFTRSLEYKQWEQKFMENTATQINLIRSKLLGSNY